MISRGTIIAGLAFGLAGCATAPAYVRPSAPVPDSWPTGAPYLVQSEAALSAAKIRLRPILMTSFAFIFGVLPLALATGAGANSRIAIGTSVIGGMLTATLLAIFYIPLFFVLVRRGTRGALKAMHERVSGHPKPEPTT